MSNSPSWGSEARKLRKKANLTQGQLIEQFSYLANDLSEQERHRLEEIDVYDEATTYFGGILDTPTLSRLEKGTRTLTLRQRTMAFVWGFRQLGVLQTIEEANHLLEIGGHGNLTRAEAETLFGQNEAQSEAQSEEQAEERVNESPLDTRADAIVHENYRGDKKFANWPMLLIVGVLPLLILVVGVLFFLNNPSEQTKNDADSIAVETESTTPLPTTPLPTTPLPATPLSVTIAETTTQTLLAESLTTQLGITGNEQPVENIHVRDQDDADDDWNKFIKLIFTDDPYLGYRSFFLPTYIEPTDLTALTVEANYRGRGIDGQVWTWSLYNWTSKSWEPIGNNHGAPWWMDWILFSFTPAAMPADFIHPVTREIQVQLQASDMSDSMDLDYEAIVIEFYKPMAGQPERIPANISEDFATKTIDSAKWNSANAPSAMIDGGQLWFDTPINEGNEWTSESLEFNGEIAPISRLNFELLLEASNMSGSLGIVTGCQNDLGWMNVFAGEDPPYLFAEYAIQDQTDSGERIEIMPIENGRLYKVNLSWIEDGVQLSVEGQADATPLLIPCNVTEYFNISTSTDVGEKVKGSVDRIRVWY